MELVRWFPDQVAQAWVTIRPCIEASLPPISGHSEERMNHVLESILCGTLDVYVAFDGVDKPPLGLLVLSSINVIDSTERTLLVYALYKFDYVTLTRDIVMETMSKIVDIARANLCQSVSAYTNLPGVVKAIKMLKGTSAYTFIRLEV